MVRKALLGQGFVLGSWLAIVGVGIDADAATRREEAGYLYVFGLHQFDEILHDDVHAVFMKVAMVAKRE